MTGGDGEVLDHAVNALEDAGEDAAEVTVKQASLELTRFADNAIHQNVAETSMRWRARVIAGRRVGVADMTGRNSDVGVRLLAAARDTGRLQPESDVAPLPLPDGAADSGVAYSVATRDATPEQRAAIVETVVRAAAARNLRAYGYVSTQTIATGIASTQSLRRSATSTQAGAVVVVRGESGAGYAARYATDVKAIDAAELAEEAVDTCLRNQDADAVAPGDYEVVLSPYAVAELLSHLGWMGFSALAVQEQRSFMRMGERLMSESVSVRDDAHTDALFPYPFDAEGVSTQVVPLIDRGVCAGVVYDTPTALRDGVASTGHSLPQPNTWGPFPHHLTMDGGTLSRDELLAPIKRGLYITRLWYVRDVHPLRTIITGMTREGTFRIEDGRLGRPVRDLRFTQSIVDALADVRGMSRDRHLELDEEESGVLAPWLHLGSFTFSS